MKSMIIASVACLLSTANAMGTVNPNTKNMLLVGDYVKSIHAKNELVQQMIEEHGCKGEHCEEMYLEEMDDWPETMEDTLIDLKIGNETTNCTWTR